MRLTGGQIEHLAGQSAYQSFVLGDGEAGSLPPSLMDPPTLFRLAAAKDILIGLSSSSGSTVPPSHATIQKVLEKTDELQKKLLKGLRGPGAEVEAPEPPPQATDESAENPDVAAKKAEMEKLRAAVAANGQIRAVLGQLKLCAETIQRCREAFAAKPPIAQAACLEAIQRNAAAVMEHLKDLPCVMEHLKDLPCISVVGEEAGPSMESLNRIIGAVKRGESVDVELAALGTKIRALEEDNAALRAQLEARDRELQEISEQLKRPLYRGYPIPEIPDIKGLDPEVEARVNELIQEFLPQEQQ
jgi:hypothetical protein